MRVIKRQRCVVYARLSQDRTGQRAGVSRQLEDCRALAQARGFEIVAELVDNDTSAAGTKKRPEFEKMLATLAAGEADIVVAWAWDRLERNRRDALRLIEVGQEHRLVVALVRGSDIDMSTASGRLVADLLAGVARAEIEAKSERQIRASLQRAEKGHPPARRAFGYQQDGTPHPIEAPVVAELFSLYLAGATLSGLAKKLNDDGHCSTRGKRWDDTGVRVLLGNPRYVGERYYRGERVAQGTWEPLVTAETFEAAKARMNDPSRKKRRPARKHLGSGLFLCHCGAPVRVNYDGQGYRAYACSARKHMGRRADPVDDFVMRVVAERLRRGDLEDLLAPAGPAVDVAVLHQQALGYRARLDELGRDYADGALTARQVSVATKRIEEQLAEIEAQLADAGRGSALASIAGSPDLGDTWLALPLDRQRAVLAAIVDVVILPGRPGRGATDPNERDKALYETLRFDWRSA